MALTVAFVCTLGDRYTVHTRSNDVWVQEYITRAPRERCCICMCVRVHVNVRKRARGRDEGREDRWIECIGLDFVTGPQNQRDPTRCCVAGLERSA